MKISTFKTLLLVLSLLLPLGYAQAANDNGNPGNSGSSMSMKDLHNASDEELEATFGGDKAVQIRAILDEMKEHQRAMAQLKKQLAQTTGNSALAPANAKGKDKNADKQKGKDKAQDKAQNKKNKNTDTDLDE